MKDTKPGIKKDAKPDIKKDAKSDIKKDTKSDIKKDTKPDIKIGKKTSLEVFEVVKFKFKNKSDWEKKVITWVFWKSHVTKLCENGYVVEIVMHIQGLKSFTHVQMKYFLLMNIKQSFQKITQKLA